MQPLLFNESSLIGILKRNQKNALLIRISASYNQQRSNKAMTLDDRLRWSQEASIDLFIRRLALPTV